MGERLRPIGLEIDTLHEIRERKRGLERTLEDVKRELRAAEENLIQRLEKEGLPKASGKAMTVSVSERTTFAIDNWDDVKNYILDNRMVDVLQKRASATICRELMDMGRQVPGIVPHTKQVLNMRNIK